MQVYIGQFDSFWKLSWDEWQQLCRRGADGWGYDLAAYRSLKCRPRFIHRDRDRSAGGMAYWTCRNDILYVEPLDWYPEDFAGYLDARPDR